MRRSSQKLLTMVVAAAAAGTTVAAGPAAPSGSTSAPGGVDDVVVVAIVDNGFGPYHQDFLGSLMPQHLDDDPTNDLPLDRSPAEWLPGFDETAFDEYESLRLTLPDPDEPMAMEALYAQDIDEWDYTVRSTPSSVAGYWVPGTKIVAGISFGGARFADPPGSSHGAGTTSVAVGNVHGTCPECLIVMIRYGSRPDGEAAVDWALSQPWIDVVSNSFGYSTGARDQVYDGSDVGLQADAVLRGQGLFWSAGNGQGNAFVAPASTLLSSQKGGDWTITVGAINPDGASFTGANKPVDVAAPGIAYPSAPFSGTGNRTDGEGQFSGTSNATPVLAGTYARALYRVRTALAGPSRVQQDGIIARGEPVACGDVRPDCELGDGVLTGLELRTRFLEGAVHTDQGYTAGPTEQGGTPAVGPEHEFLNEGHGSYFGTLGDVEEQQDRILGPMFGTREALERPDGEREWMVVDSYCRQLLWGQWSEGYWFARDPLPPPDPAWPMRQAYLDGCEQYADQG